MVLMRHYWFSKPPLDFEYHQYKLLAFLKRTDRAFQQKSLYPYYEEVNKRLEEIEEFQSWTQEYHVNEEEKLDTLLQIVTYARPLLQWYQWRGKTLRQELWENITITPLGILSHYPKEGFLFIDVPNARIELYLYQLQGLTQRSGIPYFKIYWIGQRSRYSSLERLKLHLHQLFRSRYAVPAAFIAECKIKAPSGNSIIPLAMEKIWQEYLT